MVYRFGEKTARENGDTVCELSGGDKYLHTNLKNNREAPETPELCKLFVAHHKSLLMMTPYSLVAKHMEISSTLTRKCSMLNNFHSARRGYLWGEKRQYLIQHWTPCATKPTCQTRYGPLIQECL